MKMHRLFEIVYLLMNKKRVTTQELAAHFEVSKRTILRDIDMLSTAGIPIYTLQGKGGGVAIDDHYVLNKTVISKKEQEQILFALQSLSATQHIEVENVLGRLQSLFKKQGREWLEVDFSRWGYKTADKAKFAMLKDAVINEQALSFTYSGLYKETTDRKVYPLKLVFKSNSWYLQAFCLSHHICRTFKISRIINIALLAEHFNNAEFDIPDIEEFDYPSSSLVDLKLHFPAQSAYRVYDEFDKQYVTKNKDDSYTVSIQLPNDDWLYDYLLHLGFSVEVLEPQHVRSEFVERIEKIRGIYLKT